MPLYSYKCPECSHTDEFFHRMEDRDKQFCPECDHKMDRPVVANACMVEIWKPLTLEHIADEPMTFNSKKELRDYCKKSKCQSAALL